MSQTTSRTVGPDEDPRLGSDRPVHALHVGSDRTLGQLVVQATDDVKGLVQDHISLAKAEVQQGVKVMGKGAGIVGAAAFLGLLGLIFLFHTLAQVIAIWLPVWAGYAIVTGVLLLVAAILGMVGVKTLKKAKPKPEHAIASAERTLAELKP
ncbi:MAG: phage holin family protein [Tetrasphaera sp.]|nr:phage holin family protein [Tetrasphaera sp.]